MNSDEARIWQRAGLLFDEQVTGTWTPQEQDAYADSVIRRAVQAIAAEGEMAGLRQIIRMVTPNDRYATDLVDRCTAIIDQVRHEQFDGNTGWTWDAESQRWTARRGTAMVTAAWPKDQMPPVRADRFAVQLTGELRHVGVVQIMDDPGEANLPWSKPVMAEVPEHPGSAEWYAGLRARLYVGTLCSPCGRTNSRVCLQPHKVLQGEDTAPCVPVDPDHVRLWILDGKLADYS